VSSAVSALLLAACVTRKSLLARLMARSYSAILCHFSPRWHSLGKRMRGEGERERAEWLQECVKASGCGRLPMLMSSFVAYEYTEQACGGTAKITKLCFYRNKLYVVVLDEDSDVVKALRLEDSTDYNCGLVLVLSKVIYRTETLTLTSALRFVCLSVFVREMHHYKTMQYSITER